LLFKAPAVVDSLVEYLYTSGEISLKEFIDLLSYNVFKRTVIAFKIYYRRKINYL
jgi:hypothetical protein